MSRPSAALLATFLHFEAESTSANIPFFIYSFYISIEREKGRLTCLTYVGECVAERGAGETAPVSGGRLKLSRLSRYFAIQCATT